MTMATLALLIYYGVGLIPTWRWLFRRGLFNDKDPTWGEVGFAAAVATATVGFLTPFWLFGLLFFGLRSSPIRPRQVARWLGGESRQAKIKRREFQREQVLQRIQEQERELEIK